MRVYTLMPLMFLGTFAAIVEMASLGNSSASWFPWVLHILEFKPGHAILQDWDTF